MFEEIRLLGIEEPLPDGNCRDMYGYEHPDLTRSNFAKLIEEHNKLVVNVQKLMESKNETTS